MMKIIPAHRPEDEGRASWRALIRGGLQAKESEQLDFDRHEFVPCFTCSSSPGCPSLCRGCLANRQTITEVHEQLAAVTAARDEACTLIQTLVDAQARYSPAEVATSAAFAAMKREIDKRIAKLRKV